MKPSRHRTRTPAGFTLIEIMVVIVIIGLIATLVAPGIMERLGKAKITTTEARMSTLVQVLNSFRMEHNQLPESLEELMAEDEKNLDEPWISDPGKLRDAWDHEFVYRKLSSRKFELISLGSDGLEGGDGEDADISSDKSKMVGS